MRATGRQQGIATLGVSLGILLMITLGAIYTGQVVLRGQQVVNNEYRAAKATLAAEAGLEWGLAQLSDGAFVRTAIVDTNSQDGLVDSNTFQAPAGLLPADVGFNLTFSNPTVGNLKLLNLTAVGCADGCSPCTSACPIRRTSRMQAQLSSSLFPAPLRSAITVKNQVTLILNAKVTNLYSNQPANDRTVWSGGSASYSNGAGTVGADGTHNTASNDPTTKANDTSLSSATVDQFFKMFFDGTPAEIQPTLTNITCGANCNSQLAGVTGQALWINSNLVLSGANTIGSPTSPVILITNQDCQLTDSNVIYGVLYCRNLTGTGTATKVTTIYGGIIAQNNYNASKVPDVVYDPAVMNRLVNLFGGSMGSGVTRVPGGWRDFP